MTEHEGQTYEPRWKVLDLDELCNLPETKWRIRDTLPERGLAFLYGPSGCGKTFLALNLAYSIAEGRAWFGRAVKRTGVLYMALESGVGIGTRVKALRKHWGETYGVSEVEPRPFKAITAGAMSLNSGADIVDLGRLAVATVGEGCVIVLDTLHMATIGMNENDSADMGVVVREAGRLAELCKGLVILVHHTGKDSDRGMRGSSSLFAAADTVIKVDGGKGKPHTWTVEKSKEGPSGSEEGFLLVPVSLVKREEDDSEVTSFAVEVDEIAPEDRRGMVSGKNALLVYGALMQAVDKACVDSPKDFPSHRHAFEKSLFKEIAMQALEGAGVKGSHRSTRFSEALKSLKGTGHVLEKKKRIGGEMVDFVLFL